MAAIPDMWRFDGEIIIWIPRHGYVSTAMFDYRRVPDMVLMPEYA